MKNTFYFTCSNLLLLRYLDFCPNFLVMKKNMLIRKLWLISKFMTLQTGQQTITMHNYPVSQEVKATRQ